MTPTERAKILLKKCTRDFQNRPPFERSACFYVTVTKNFERCEYFNFETGFLENENLLQKTGVHFLVESTQVEYALFQYQTAISEATVKTNRMVSTEWTYHK